MAKQTLPTTFALVFACACSSGASKGTSERMAECASRSPREAYYCNKRLYEEVQAIKKTEAEKDTSQEAAR